MALSRKKLAQHLDAVYKRLLVDLEESNLDEVARFRMHLALRVWFNTLLDAEGSKWVNQFLRDMDGAGSSKRAYVALSTLIGRDVH